MKEERQFLEARRNFNKFAINVIWRQSSFLCLSHIDGSRRLVTRFICTTITNVMEIAAI